MKRVPRFALSVAGAALLGIGTAAAAPQRTWNFLTTGNGHGFQVYDTNQQKITAFLEHPYRYLRPGADPKSDGIGRRNLIFDFYFGIHENGGGGWLNGAAASADPDYEEQDNIIHAPFSVGGVTADCYFFAPFGYEGNAMVALLKAPGASDGFALFNFHMGVGSPDSPDASGEALSPGADAKQPAVVEVGAGTGAMIYVALSGADHADCQSVFDKVKNGQNLGDNTACAGNDIVPAFQKKLDGEGWMAVAMQYVDDPATAAATAAALRAFAGTRTPLQILNDAKMEWNGWRKPPPTAVTLSPEEAKVWRQGEAVLRMGQIREPNTDTRKNNGMMLASLPPGEWHTGWVRDATYATVALARMGHLAEARASLDFFLNANPVGRFSSFVGNQSYRISVVRYFGSGEEQADYSGQPSPNVEIDGWGLVMWAARQYVDAANDVPWLMAPTKLGPAAYDAIAAGIAAPLEANLESNGIARADSSIWEVHDDNKKHFAYTTQAAARGFCDMATLAQRMGKSDEAARYQALAQKIKDGYFASFLDQRGAIAGSIEGLGSGVYTDAAVVEAFNWRLLTDYSGKTALATFDLLNRLRVDSGGYKRNDNSQSSYDNNEWILIDLRMSDAFRRAGHGAEADALVQEVVDKASANFYLLPELYNAVPADGAIGKYTGSIPMVGYGGGAFVLTMLDRAGLLEPDDCGASQLTDGGVTPSDSGGGTTVTGPGGTPIPYVAACPCRLTGHSAMDTGQALLLAVPWLLILGRLLRRRRQ